MTEWLLNPDRGVVLDALKTAIFVIILWLTRAAVLRAVTWGADLSPETRRSWSVSLRNGLFVVFIIGAAFIWAHQLHTFAVSLLAIAVAVVLATKELILCLSGSVVRLSTDAFSVGDRISVGTARGKVLDQNFLATRLLEIGPGEMSNQYTGRTVVFPNGLLLSTPVINETNSMEYGFQVIKIPLRSDQDWRKAEQVLLDAARAECEPFLSAAGKQMKKMGGKDWVDVPSVEPRVTLHVPEPDCLELQLRMPTPNRHPTRLGQAILRRFLSEFPMTAPPPGARDR